MGECACLAADRRRGQEVKNDGERIDPNINSINTSIGFGQYNVMKAILSISILIFYLFHTDTIFKLCQSGQLN